MYTEVMKLGSENKRQSIVDEIRGISLLGILMANMLIFQYGMWGKEELVLFNISSVDKIANLLLKVFVEGSFMPIFAFLFGYGMLKMKEGLVAKEMKHRRVLLRRAIMLILLGLVHSQFIWDGDILMFYGMLSFLLLLFLKRKAKTVLIWGLVLLMLISLLGIGADSSSTDSFSDKEKTEQYVKKSIDVYQNGSYKDIISFRKNEPTPYDMKGILLLIVLILIPFLVAPMFLFGIYAAKKNIFHEPYNKRYLYRRWGLILFILGLIMKSLKYIWPNFILSGVGELGGATILSLGYIMCFSWLLSVSKVTLLRQGFEAVGKLSLTNYLMQSIICTTLFYGYGFGWFGKLGVLAGIGISLAIYAMQWFISLLYLKRFRIGPVEWLLRIWTYWSWRGNNKKVQLSNRNM